MSVGVAICNLLSPFTRKHADIVAKLKIIIGVELKVQDPTRNIQT